MALDVTFGGTAPRGLPSAIETGDGVGRDGLVGSGRATCGPSAPTPTVTTSTIVGRLTIARLRTRDPRPDSLPRTGWTSMVLDSLRRWAYEHGGGA